MKVKRVNSWWPLIVAAEEIKSESGQMFTTQLYCTVPYNSFSPQFQMLPKPRNGFPQVKSPTQSEVPLSDGRLEAQQESGQVKVQWSGRPHATTTGHPPPRTVVWYGLVRIPTVRHIVSFCPPARHGRNHRRARHTPSIPPSQITIIRKLETRPS